MPLPADPRAWTMGEVLAEIQQLCHPALTEQEIRTVEILQGRYFSEPQALPEQVMADIAMMLAMLRARMPLERRAFDICGLCDGINRHTDSCPGIGIEGPEDPLKVQDG